MAVGFKSKNYSKVCFMCPKDIYDKFRIKYKKGNYYKELSNFIKNLDTDALFKNKEEHVSGQKVVILYILKEDLMALKKKLMPYPMNLISKAFRLFVKEQVDGTR